MQLLKNNGTKKTAFKRFSLRTKKPDNLTARIVENDFFENHKIKHCCLYYKVKFLICQEALWITFRPK